MAITAPCKDCPDRYLGCHSKCPKYQQFEVENEKRKQAEQEQKCYNDIMYTASKRAAIRRIRQRKH